MQGLTEVGWNPRVHHDPTFHKELYNNSAFQPRLTGYLKKKKDNLKRIRCLQFEELRKQGLKVIVYFCGVRRGGSQAQRLGLCWSNKWPMQLRQRLFEITAKKDERVVIAVTGLSKGSLRQLNGRFPTWTICLSGSCARIE